MPGSPRDTCYDLGARDGTYVDATGLACGGDNALRPWPNLEAHEGKKQGGARGSGEI